MKTAAEVKQDFIRRGITIANWAKEHGYRPYTVYRVLDGKLKGYYGISHRIAVDLGLKESVQDRDTSAGRHRRAS
jgi:gp16 family phage-associated protein